MGTRILADKVYSALVNKVPEYGNGTGECVTGEIKRQGLRRGFI